MKFKVGDKVKVAKVNFGWKKNWVGKTFTIREINPNGTIGYSEPHYGTVEPCPYVFRESELLPVVDSKIVITTDGKITTAKLYENGKVVKTAEAKCCPEDTFDFNVGAKLAVERLTGQVDEWKVVNRPVKVGDYISLTYADFSFDRVGDILKVDEVSCSGRAVHVYDKNHPNRPHSSDSKYYWTYVDYQYEVVEKVTKEVKETPKYYNGKVVCVENNIHDNEFTIGKVYEVKDGKVIDNFGKCRPSTNDRIKSLDDFKNNGYFKGWYYDFIPFVEN